MLDHDEFARWRTMALDAADTANEQMDRGSHHWACFLAEQGAQFMCKGLLHGLGLPAWGHDLVVLGARIDGDAGVSVTGDVADALGRLSRHYIATRDPDAHPAGTPAGHYRHADAEQAVSDARAVIAFVDATWKRLVDEAARAEHGPGPTASTDDDTETRGRAAEPGDGPDGQ